ncbi:MAG: hypothetical protein NC433_16975 [Clostridiales bacterium]|nr:hypothetical protein [Clostridiales bacterium]
MNGYFEAALSDFVFDVAAGGAIRHLTDRGHSVEQIMKELDYPVARSKVEKAVYRHLTESGILISKLPEENEKAHIRHMQSDSHKDKNKFVEELLKNIEAYGNENSYMECPFGIWLNNNDDKLQQAMSVLSVREQEYIMGIRWEHNIMYHRLNDRMREIGVKLVIKSSEEWRFFFLN